MSEYGFLNKGIRKYLFVNFFIFSVAFSTQTPSVRICIQLLSTLAENSYEWKKANQIFSGMELHSTPGTLSVLLNEGFRLNLMELKFKLESDKLIITEFSTNPNLVRTAEKGPKILAEALLVELRKNHSGITSIVFRDEAFQVEMGEMNRLRDRMVAKFQETETVLSAVKLTEQAQPLKGKPLESITKVFDPLVIFGVTTGLRIPKSYIPQIDDLSSFVVPGRKNSDGHKDVQARLLEQFPEFKYFEFTSDVLKELDDPNANHREIILRVLQEKGISTEPREVRIPK